MQSPIRLSACIITRNEEAFIERCIQSVHFADEVIVIDAESSDQTRTIAEGLGAKVHTNPWKGFSHQRNLCLEHAKGDWVFFIDADEEASKELGAELRQWISLNDRFQASGLFFPHCFSVRREEFFLGRHLKYGPGNPSFQWRFFRKNAVRFVGDVHEYPQFEGPIGALSKGFLNHNPHLNVDRFLKKLNHYTTLEALDRFQQGQRTSLFHAVFTFWTTLFKNGIRYQGFRNGKEGWILIILESFSRVVRHLKLWTYWRIHDQELKIRLDHPLPPPGTTPKPAGEIFQRKTWVPPTL